MDVPALPVRALCQNVCSTVQSRYVRSYIVTWTKYSITGEFRVRTRLRSIRRVVTQSWRTEGAEVWQQLWYLVDLSSWPRNFISALGTRCKRRQIVVGKRNTNIRHRSKLIYVSVISVSVSPLSKTPFLQLAGVQRSTQRRKVTLIIQTPIDDIKDLLDINTPFPCLESLRTDDRQKKKQKHSESSSYSHLRLQNGPSILFFAEEKSIKLFAGRQCESNRIPWYAPSTCILTVSDGLCTTLYDKTLCTPHQGVTWLTKNTPGNFKILDIRAVIVPRNVLRSSLA